jgi:catechol 2,3-dioxygenase-like lactoylglutathione lyase family enzyme
MTAVEELRIVLTVEDFDAAVRLYRDVLGLDVDQEWDGPNGRGAILAAPRATLEVLDTAQSGYVDQVEAGRRGVSGPVRIGLGVPDSDETGRRLVEAGAAAVAAPVTTPWGHRNVRLIGPPGVQLTLFTVPGVAPAAPAEGEARALGPDGLTADAG